MTSKFKQRIAKLQNADEATKAEHRVKDIIRVQGAAIKRRLQHIKFVGAPDWFRINAIGMALLEYFTLCSMTGRGAHAVDAAAFYRQDSTSEDIMTYLDTKMGKFGQLVLNHYENHIAEITKDDETLKKVILQYDYIKGAQIPHVLPEKLGKTIMLAKLCQSE